MGILGHGQAEQTERVDSAGSGTSTYMISFLHLKTLPYFWKEMAQGDKAYSAGTR